MIYTAYYDASGKEENTDHPLVVAGIAATAEKWFAFDRHWGQVLATYGAEFLDTAQCAHWKGQPYSTWNKDENLRRPFLCGLIEALTNAAAQIVVVRIIPADFHAINAQYELTDTSLPGPYSMAAFKCAGMMEALLSERDKEAHVTHIVERGDSGQGALVEFARKGAPMSVLSKRDPKTGDWLHPFGACDLVAYEYRKGIQQSLATGGKPFRFRGTLRALRGKIPSRIVGITRADLIAMCEAAPNSYPKREPQSVDGIHAQRGSE